MVIEVNFLTEIVNKKWQETQTSEHTIFKITKSTWHEDKRKTDVSHI